MSTIEIFATIFGLISVYLTVKENIWCWPTGLVMVILYIFIFYEAKLYSDTILQIIYVPMQIYGWYYWIKGRGKEKEVPVTLLRNPARILWTAIILAGTAAWGYYMANYTDASFPYWDSLIVVMSLVAQWFLSKKYIESWVLWITVDVIAINVYFLKDLYLTSGLYLVFLGLAISGLLAWKNSRHKHATA